MFRSPCSICTDLLSASDLGACPCGHVYHVNCLDKWLVRSRTCPTCRVACPSSIKLFFSDVQEIPVQEDVVNLRNELRKQTALNLEKDELLKVLNKQSCETHTELLKIQDRLHKLQETAEHEQAVQKTLKKQVKFLKQKTEHTEELEDTVVELRDRVGVLERFQTLIDGTHEKAEQMLKNIGTSPKTASELASQLVMMKREHEKMRQAKINAYAEKEQLEKDNNFLNHRLKTEQLECRQLKKEMRTIQEQLKEMDQEKQNLKKKVDKMQQSFDTSSPRGTLINRLLQESPAPLKLDESTDENVEIVEGNSENQSFSIKKARPEFVSPVHPGALQKNRKRSYINLEKPGRLSTGYNGFGGHSTVLMPSQAKKTKKVAKPATKSKFVRIIPSSPPLPRM